MYSNTSLPNSLFPSNSSVHNIDGPYSHTLFARLPVELLTLILHLGIDQELYNSNRIFQALTLSHVCRYWHAVMLDDSAFWDLIDLRHPTISRMLCFRSAKSPLRIVFKMTAYDRSSIVSPISLSWLTPHIHRLMGFYFAGNQALIRGILVLLSTALSLLSHLTGFLKENISDFSQLHAEIQDDRIVKICMDRIYLKNWQYACMPTDFTRFALSCLDLTSRPTAPQLISIFSASPRINSIGLLNSTKTLTDRERNLRVDVVELRNLRVFRIADASPPTVSWLLAHISVPPTTTFRFDCHGMRDLSALLPPDLSRLRTFTAQQYLGRPINTVLHITNNHLAILNEAPIATATEQISSVHFALAPDDIHHVLINLPSFSSALSPITTLRAVSSSPHGWQQQNITSSVWRAVFAKMPLLSSLELGGSWATSIICALTIMETPQADTSHTEAVKFCVCSNLRILRLEDETRDDSQLLYQVDVLERCLRSWSYLCGKSLDLLQIDLLRESSRVLVAPFLERLEDIVASIVVRQTTNSVALKANSFRSHRRVNRSPSPLMP